jgi:PKHD-type hydroxylase
LIVQADVLSPEEVLAIKQGLAAAPFRDGRVTAGAAAGNVKNNEQARGNDPGVIALARRVRLALDAHPMVRTWARPVRWSTLMFARYGPGGRYGLHTDNAVMFDEGGWPVRTDISFTMFLFDLDSYEGGALVVRDPVKDREFRPKAGSAIFYPAGQLWLDQQTTGLPTSGETAFSVGLYGRCAAASVSARDPLQFLLER